MLTYRLGLVGHLFVLVGEFVALIIPSRLVMKEQHLIPSIKILSPLPQLFLRSAYDERY